MKSYSSALTNTCSAALSQKISAAVKSATDRDDRSRNVIIYGFQEVEGKVLPKKFSETFDEISADVANQILRNAKLLRTKEGFKSVYICPDRTVSERRAYKKLLEELKLKRQSEPD